MMKKTFFSAASISCVMLTSSSYSAELTSDVQSGIQNELTISSTGVCETLSQTLSMPVLNTGADVGTVLGTTIIAGTACFMYDCQWGSDRLKYRSWQCYNPGKYYALTLGGLALGACLIFGR